MLPSHPWLCENRFLNSVAARPGFLFVKCSCQLEALTVVLAPRWLYRHDPDAFLLRRVHMLSEPARYKCPSHSDFE